LLAELLRLCSVCQPIKIIDSHREKCTTEPSLETQQTRFVLLELKAWSWDIWKLFSKCYLSLEPQILNLSCVIKSTNLTQS